MKKSMKKMMDQLSNWKENIAMISHLNIQILKLHKNAQLGLKRMLVAPNISSGTVMTIINVTVAQIKLQH